MDLTTLLKDSGLLEGNRVWIAVFLVIFSALLFDFIQKRILRHLHGKAITTDNTWDDAMLDALRKPLSLLIWTLGITFAVQIMAQNTPIFMMALPVRDVGVIASITWFLVGFVKRAQKNIVDKNEKLGKPIDVTTVDAIGKLVRISIVITALLVILQTLGFSVSGVLAFGGIGGIAVGFAAKDLLSNFFGGLYIFLDRPFAVGDWIRSPDRDIEGFVEEIGWRLTRIRTFDKRPLYVPNSMFNTIALENPSRMSNRRIYETIGIRYDDAGKMSVILKDTENMLKTHPEIDQNQLLMVNFNSYGPSSLDFIVYTFTRTTVWTEYNKVKEDILLKIYDIIISHDAQVAFPTSTIHIPEGLDVKSKKTNEKEAAFKDAAETDTEKK
jgi:MscS family membrane protein